MLLQENTIYNCDCIDLLREMAGGGDKSRLVHYRSTLRNWHWKDELYKKRGNKNRQSNKTRLFG